MSNEKKTPRTPDVFSDAKLRLYAKKPLKEGAKAPSFKITTYENNPVIFVDYGFKNDKGYAQTHETPLDPIVFAQMLTAIKRAAAAKGNYGIEFENWGHPFIWDRDQNKNVRSKDKLNISNIEIVRTEDGLVMIRYLANRKEPLEFIFEDNNDYHRVKVNGNVGAQATSGLAALAWVDVMTEVYLTVFATKWVEPEYRRRFREEQARKFAGNNGNRGSGNQGQTNNQSSSSTNNTANNSYQGGGEEYDDDIPF